MRCARSSALILLAEIATQADLSLVTRIAVGMSRDTLLALDEIEPLGHSQHRHESPSVFGVVRLLEAAPKSSPREGARLRLATQWLRGESAT